MVMSLCIILRLIGGSLAECNSKEVSQRCAPRRWCRLRGEHPRRHRRQRCCLHPHRSRPGPCPAARARPAPSRGRDARPRRPARPAAPGPAARHWPPPRCSTPTGLSCAWRLRLGSAHVRQILLTVARCRHTELPLLDWLAHRQSRPHPSIRARATQARPSKQWQFQQSGMAGGTR